MALLSKDEVQSVFEKIKSYTSANEIQLSIEGGLSSIIRFARNEVVDSILRNELIVTVTLNIDGQSAVVTGNSINESSLKKLVSKAEQLAVKKGQSGGLIPIYGPTTIKETATWFDSSATLSPEQRVEFIAESIAYCSGRKLIAGGYLEDKQWFNAVFNTKGITYYHKSTPCRYTINVRNTESKGSGYASSVHYNIKAIKPLLLAEYASQKAQSSTNSKTPEIGKLPVVLEARAVYDLVRSLLTHMDNKQSASSSETRKLLAPVALNARISLFSDPTSATQPFVPFAQNGQKREKVIWIEKGQFKQLPVEWVPITMEGGDTTQAELIKQTEKGVLISRFHDLVCLDELGVVLTGVTQDGTYLIEGGKIKHPVKNMRFQINVLEFLKGIAGIGKSEIVDESTFPSLSGNGFYFTAMTDSY